MDTEVGLVRRAQRLVALTWLFLMEPDRHTRKALAMRFGVSERQITKDLAVLDRALDTAIQHTRQGYRFADSFAAIAGRALGVVAEEWLNATEAAARTGMTPAGIAAAIRQGRLPATRSPHHRLTWRIKRADLDAFVARRTARREEVARRNTDRAAAVQARALVRRSRTTPTPAAPPAVPRITSLTLAAELGCHPASVRGHAARIGVAARHPRGYTLDQAESIRAAVRAARQPKPPRPEPVRAARVTGAALAAEFGVTRQAIWQYAARMGLGGPRGFSPEEAAIIRAWRAEIATATKEIA